MSEDQKQKGINIKIDEETHKQLRHLALDHSQTFKDFVKTVLTNHAQKEIKQ
jgi:uncharacterized protein (DUF1778 family)